MELYVPGDLANTLTPDSMHLRQYSRNELIVSLLARCPVGDPGVVGRSHLMDRRGDGVPIILEESVVLSGRKPEYSVIDHSELRLVIWGGGSHRGVDPGGREPARPRVGRFDSPNSWITWLAHQPWTEKPPSMRISAPVVKEDASEAR